MFLAVKEVILQTWSSFFPSYIFRRPSRMSFQEVKSHVVSATAAGFLVKGRSLCSTFWRWDLPHPKPGISLFNYLLHYFYLFEKHLEGAPPPSLVFYILAVSIVWDSCQHPHQQQPVLNEDTWASLQDLEEDPAGQYDFTEASRHVEVEKHDSASLFMSKNFS